MEEQEEGGGGMRGLWTVNCGLSMDEVGGKRFQRTKERLGARRQIGGGLPSS